MEGVVFAPHSILLVVVPTVVDKLESILGEVLDPVLYGTLKPVRVFNGGFGLGLTHCLEHLILKELLDLGASSNRSK